MCKLLNCTEVVMVVVEDQDQERMEVLLLVFFILAQSLIMVKLFVVMEEVVAWSPVSRWVELARGYGVRFHPQEAIAITATDKQQAIPNWMQTKALLETRFRPGQHCRCILTRRTGVAWGPRRRIPSQCSGVT